jgi:uncharacterized alpha-E superfamily protein
LDIKQLKLKIMLGRVANTIYWMNRYLERAENYARLWMLTLIYHGITTNEIQQWQPLVVITGVGCINP